MDYQGILVVDKGVGGSQIYRPAAIRIRIY